MRIISGAFRGKKLVSAPEMITRPTLDRAKESLFNIIESRLRVTDKKWADIVFADVFAGSGAIGIEALSRGAVKAVFFEKNQIALRFLKQNLNGLKNVNIQILKEACEPPIVAQAADILFMDAPYHQGLIERALPLFEQAGWIGDQTLVILETDVKEEIILPPFLQAERSVSYGRNRFIFAQKRSVD